MLFVLFHVGSDRYVVEAQKVVEIVPLVKLNNFSNTPDYIAGLCNYRTQPLPVVDVSCLLSGVESRKIMSTRILLVKFLSDSEAAHTLGMIVESATETITIQRKKFKNSAVQGTEGNVVSNVMTDEHGIIQWMDVDQLLTKRDCDMLYGSHAEVHE